MEKFSKRLVALRRERGLTQSEMAEVLSRKRSTYSGYEVEGKEPDFETVCLLADYFGVTTDYLLGYSNNRTSVDTVFCNDHVNFKEHFEALHEDLRPIVEQSFDAFYLLLCRDMQSERPERLLLYRKLFRTLQTLRSEIRKRIERSGGQVSDAVELSNLITMQNQLKSEMSVVLDELMQADMAIAFDIKKGEDVSSEKTAM